LFLGLVELHEKNTDEEIEEEKGPYEDEDHKEQLRSRRVLV